MLMYWLLGVVVSLFAMSWPAMELGTQAMIAAGGTETTGRVTRAGDDTAYYKGIPLFQRHTEYDFTTATGARQTVTLVTGTVGHPRFTAGQAIGVRYVPQRPWLAAPHGTPSPLGWLERVALLLGAGLSAAFCLRGGVREARLLRAGAPSAWQAFNVISAPILLISLLAGLLAAFVWDSARRILTGG